MPKCININHKSSAHRLVTQQLQQFLHGVSGHPPSASLPRRAPCAVPGGGRRPVTTGLAVRPRATNARGPRRGTDRRVGRCRAPGGRRGQLGGHGGALPDQAQLLFMEEAIDVQHPLRQLPHLFLLHLPHLCKPLAIHGLKVPAAHGQRGRGRGRGRKGNYGRKEGEASVIEPLLSF